MGTNRQIRLKELLFSPSDNESATPDQVVRGELQLPSIVELEMVVWAKRILVTLALTFGQKLRYFNATAILLTLNESLRGVPEPGL